MDCLFCSMVKGEIPISIVYESDRVIAFEDIHKVAPTHVLIIPKTHMASITELSPTDTSTLSEIQRAILEVAKRTGVDQTGFRVTTNRGKSAGQTVFHLHFHLIGGRELDTTLG